MRLLHLAYLLGMMLAPCAGAQAAQADSAASGGFENPTLRRTITCEQIKQSPRTAFAPGVDLGSGRGSPTEVDWQCQGGLQTLPFLKPLTALTEEIRGGMGPPCTGSLVYALWRYHQFDLLRWGIAPDVAMEQMFERREGFSAAPSSGPDASTYLEAWSFAYYSNFVLYRRYRDELHTARALLTRHYVGMGYPDEQAAEFANYALLLYIDRAAGTFPAAQIPAIQRTLDQVAALREATNARRYVKTLEPADVRTALNLSLLMRKSPRFISTLLARVDDLDAQAESPLVYALGDTRLMKVLLKRGAHVDHQNAFGKTVLFYAIESRDRKTVELLLKHGANINHAYVGGSDAEDYGCSYDVRPGRTPLMHAAQHASVDMLKFLLQNGASLESMDSADYTATDYAFLGEQADNVAFLKSLGGQSNYVESDRRLSQCWADAMTKTAKPDELREMVKRCLATTN